MMIRHKNPSGRRTLARTFVPLALLCLLLGACASAPPSLVQGALRAPQAAQPMYLERPTNGAIYQAHLPTASLFSSERRPQAIGDTLKVDISESFKAAQRQSTDTSRDNKLAVKGPGAGRKSGGLLESLWNADASAAGSDAFKGAGTAEASSSFNGQIAVSVINVLPNGHLLVAGERSTRLNGGGTTLRFSGLVDPRDIGPGNLVSSANVVNALLESAGQGEVSEAAQRSWLQRVLTRSLTVW
ncbi:flagellar basal body L-ring protein FlgH [Roseateles sp.]|jgi:flagellar L-ring protein precursor FlgH|uniref:flagellar basal body L-ring protein FlgH n=1 Tax=Roseateles sp. TaxID=1971397 RepID=UPI0037CA0349